MEKDVCWASFMASGSVADYLAFKQKEQDEIKRISQSSELRGAVQKKTEEICNRVEHNAGFY